MYSVIFRTVFMYMLIVFSMRIMGKKNLGEFQPSDLVSTILISNLTSVVIEEPHLPIAYSISSILIIMSIEVFISAVGRKSSKFARITQGQSMILVENGVINQQTMKTLRFTVRDVLEALRNKDIFYIEEVNLAIVETTGAVNVYKDPDAKSNIKKDAIPPLPVIIDAEIISDNLGSLNCNPDKILKILNKAGKDINSILLMTMDGAGKYNITVKEEI